MKVAIIPADATQPFRFEDLDSGLKPLQDAVGGDIEVVGFRELSLNMYLNEEGKRLSLPFNVRATKFCHENQAIRVDDYICGDVVLVGPFDDEGNDTDLTQGKKTLLMSFERKSL